MINLGQCPKSKGKNSSLADAKCVTNKKVIKVGGGGGGRGSISEAFNAAVEACT